MLQFYSDSFVALSQFKVCSKSSFEKLGLHTMPLYNQSAPCLLNLYRR